jgi:hypothetical protein
MKVYSQLEKAQIENLTSDPTGTGLVAGRMWYRTDTKTFKVYDGAAVQEFVDLTSAQALSSKTLTTPTVNASAVFQEIATPAAPSAGNRKIYPKTDGWYEQNSAGVESPLGSGGSGVKNYFPTAIGNCSSVTGFSAYADAAGALPVDGTGGSPSADLTITTSAVSPLSGTSSILISKINGTNLQGQGKSIDFAIDPSDAGKVLAFTMNYGILSGTYASGDLIIYAYDVTNGGLIREFTPYSIQNHTLTSDRFFGEIQVPYNCATFRFIFHVASATTQNFVMKIDDLVFGPQAKQYGSVTTDWVSFTPVSSWVSNSTNTAKFRRVGDSIEFQYRASLTGAPTAATLTFDLPSGMSVDTGKLLTATTGDFVTVGRVHLRDSSPAATYTGEVQYLNSTGKLQVSYTSDTTSPSIGLPAVNATAPFTFATGDSVIVEGKLPIVGFSSSQLLSSDASTRVYAAKAYRGASAQTITADTDTEIVYDMLVKDTHGSYSISNGRLTAKVSGTFRFEATTQILLGATAPSSVALRAKKNGTGGAIGQDFQDDLTANKTYTLTAVGTVDLLAGEYVSIWIYSATQGTSVSGTGGTNENSAISVTQVQGPAQIAASTKILARYYSTAGQAIANAATPIIDFGTKSFDNTGSVTTGASWKFTAQKYDFYKVNGTIAYASASFTANTAVKLYLYKNGSLYSYLAQEKIDAALTTFRIATGVDTIELNSGDYIDIRTSHDESASRSLGTTAGTVFVNIESSGGL